MQLHGKRNTTHYGFGLLMTTLQIVSWGADNPAIHNLDTLEEETARHLVFPYIYTVKQPHNIM